MDTKIVEYKETAAPIIERGLSIEIDNQATMAEATEILSQVNKNLDRIKAEKEKVLAPLREAANAEKARWEPLETMFKPVVERLRGLMGAYQTALIAKQKAEQTAIASRVGEGKGKLKPETAIRKLGEIDTVETKVEADSGALSFREKKVLKIVDEKMVPDQYWIIDEDAVMKALKEGTEVPGAEIEIQQIPVNKR
jgi:hypothetical protein